MKRHVKNFSRLHLAVAEADVSVRGAPDFDLDECSVALELGDRHFEPVSHFLRR